MPQGEALDPSMILDDWINRVQNLPEEIRFIQDEIADKDKQYYDCIKTIEERDARIQKFIKANGSHEKNPREENLRSVIRENFAKAKQLADEKLALTERMKMIMDKHLRQLDIQIKMLYDRNEPGFTDPDELPSVLRPAANPPPPSRVALTVNTNIAQPSGQIQTVTAATPSAVRVANNTARSAQSIHTSASAPATPAASMILGRQAREMSAGPGSGAPKRGPRVNSGLGNIPATSSGLARHSSLGPGTPKGHQTATGAQRAGSAGPRASTKGTASGGPGRKAGTPSSTAGRKKSAPTTAAAGVSKSGLSRIKRVSKASPSSTAESDLSDAASHQSGDERSSRTGTPGAALASSSQSKGTAAAASRPQTGVGGPASGTARLKKVRKGSADEDDDDEEMVDIEDDEAGDDRKYCICQNVSFGDMVACDNEECPTEWFHWGCVGLKAEPTGLWFCPICVENMKKTGTKGK